MMKKIVCAFLVVVLMASVSFATADTNENIVFHGIPWDISINELASALKERGIPVGYNDISNDANMAVWTYEFRNSYEHDIETTGHKISRYFWNDDVVVNIAGYPVQRMEFYAHYDITDGVLKQDANESRYYLTNSWFDVDDEMAVSVYNDLSSKLTRLYGNGSENTTYIVDNTYTYTVWNGANNTAVCLYRSVSDSSDYQFVHLMYGKTNIEETLQNVRKLVIEKQVQSVAEDVTGL